jgi:hypothetical protein
MLSQLQGCSTERRKPTTAQEVREDCRMDAEAHIATATSVASASAVSWGAIIAGAAAAVAASLLLFALAAGLDLASISAWPRRGVSSGSLTLMTAVALIVTQSIASGVGGYITGRLRTRWIGTHAHEVFFRDTAHGFITWCVATIVMASGALSSASAFLSITPAGDTHASLPAVRHPHPLSPGSDSFQLSVRGGLLEPSLQPPEAQPPEAQPSEAEAQEGLPGKLVLPSAPPVVAGAPMLVTGAAADDPAELVGPDAADTGATRAAATGSFLTALAMLMGAFVASVSAVMGGRRRDVHP